MPRRILIAEDEPLLAELIKDRLELLGYEVRCAEDGARALRMLEEEGADLILMDLIMPDSDGFDLIEKLRAKKEYARTPVIALTAKTLTQEERRSLSDYGAHLVMKPFEPRALAEKISQLLVGYQSS